MNANFALYVYAGALSLILSIALTACVRRLALRWNILDHPGDRKVHREPMPLMGGVAIVLTFYIVIVGHIAALALLTQFGEAWFEAELLAFLGPGAKVKVGGILAGGLLIFILGVVDDLMSLTPWVKLVGQIIAATVLVLSDVHLELFVLSNPWIAGAATVFWIVLMTNSMNFLDNMDGLCGGVAIIAALSFFLGVQSYDQGDHLVRLLLVIFAGSVGGFLFHNLNPARIFMGDAGSMFNGYILATVAVVGTFHIEGASSPVAVATPILALSVPLFYTASVVFLRWRAGQSIMLGDKRHFSHRLVDLGMSPRHAVEFIFLAGAVVGLGGALLPSVGPQGTYIILAQSVGVYLLIVLLMNAARKSET